MKSFGPFRLDGANQSLWRGDTRVPLMPKPFAVLQHLVDRAGRLVTQDQLLEAIWPDTFVQPEVLRRYILEVRRALDDRAEAPRFVQTFPKRGYQFIAEVIDRSADQSIGHSDDARANAGANDGNGAGPGTGKLVGRASAVEDLRRYLAQILAGRRHVIFVVGEPGIGKTSLADAFEHLSANVEGAPAAVARGQSVEGFGGKEPYYPLLEAIGQLARGPLRTLVVDTLATYAPTWLIQFPSLMRPEQQAALQREILGATRERMVRELCEALEVITQTVPLVLILEDLHWVDPSTLDVISAIARRREPARLLVLGTLRPAELILSDSPLKALKQDLLVHRLSHEVVLERLQEADVAAYVAAGFAPGELPAGFSELIYRHSDGNPLFMTAMIEHLAQRRVLVPADGSGSGRGRWRLTVPLEQVDPGVPDTLKQMLEMQLRNASDAEQQLLTCASVAGQHFTTWAVATMLECDAVRAEELCEALVERQQFLKASGVRELANGRSSPEYQFRHALYREVLYRRLKPTPRETFHRRLAEGLEGLRPSVEPEMAAEIALHFEEGCEYERAVKYLLLAAHNASRRYAHAQAIVVLERARELVAKVESPRRQELDLHVLERIGNAYHALGDIERSVSTYRGLATQAAEAGLLTAIAEALVRRPHALESIPFFERALEIDPTFGSAYVSLSRIYSNLGEAGRAREYARKAYEWRYSVAGDERLSMAYQYHYEVTGDQARATETLEEWKRAFPLDFRPVNSLAVIHNFLGRFKRAIAEGLEAVARNPSHGYPYSNLAHAYRGSGRFDDARQVAEQAVAREVETLPTRRLLYQLAVIAGDAQEAVRHLDWGRDQPREFDMIGARAQVHGWFGRVASARQLYEDTVRVAELRNLPDVGTGHLGWALSMELTYGCVDNARQLARRVLARNPGYDARLRAAMVLAATGDESEAREAEEMARALAAAQPEHTLINAVLVPIVMAYGALGRGQAEAAIEALRPVAPYERGFIAAFAPIHLRGLAYLRLREGRRAAAEFQRILEHRGTDPFSPFHAFAPLGLARAYHLIGDIAAGMREYERFFTNWTTGDANVPIAIEARAEYDQLERIASEGAEAAAAEG